MTTQDDNEVLWKQYETTVLEAVSEGFLDHLLKTIADACVVRNGELKNGGITPPRSNVPPPIIQIINVPASSAPEAPKPVPKTDKPKSTLKRRRIGGGDSTFRFVDGNLYHRSDIVGTIHRHPDSPSHFFKVTGAGTKAFKIMFVDANGGKVTDPKRVPPKYAEDGKIKDPIFMGLAVLRDYVNNNLTPIQE